MKGSFFNIILKFVDNDHIKCNDDSSSKRPKSAMWTSTIFEWPSDFQPPIFTQNNTKSLFFWKWDRLVNHLMDRFPVLTKVIRDRWNRTEHHVVYSYLQFYGTPLNIDSSLFPCYKLNRCMSRLHCSFIYQGHGALRATFSTMIGLYMVSRRFCSQTFWFFITIPSVWWRKISVWNRIK